MSISKDASVCAPLLGKSSFHGAQWGCKLHVWTLFARLSFKSLGGFRLKRISFMRLRDRDHVLYLGQPDA